MEMRCYRKILHISYKDHVTSEEDRAKIQQAIGPHGDLIIVRDANCSGMVMSPIHPAVNNSEEEEMLLQTPVT